MKTEKKELELTVTEPCELMEFLLQKITNKSRNNIKSLLTHREVLVGKAVVTKYNYMLKKGQIVTVSRGSTRQPQKAQLLDILFEDADMIVINKPAGLLSIAVDTSRDRKDVTAYHLLMEYVRESNPRNRVYIVHRLDRDTSGLLIIAKNEKMKIALQENWDKLITTRGYLALVEGNPPKQQDRVVSWLLETKTHMMYSSASKGDGLEAITNYTVIRQSANFSLLDIRLETGRKNQIRVHMKDIGNPIVGDKKYGAEGNPIKRLGLHCNKLVLTHPFTQETIIFEAPLPPKFNTLLQS